MVVGQQGQAIFKKVALSEKKMILRDVTYDKLQLSVKGAAQEEMFHLIAIQNEKDEVLLCHHTADSSGIREAQKAVVNFAIKNERYFFQSELYFEAGWVVLKLDSDLFQLHRRANARITIPDAYGAIFYLSRYAGKSYFIDCKIKDFSAGGCKIELHSDKPELNVGESIKGSLHLGNRRPLELDVEVRFVQKWEKNGSVSQIAGVQFLNVNQVLETRLLSLAMDLQHELFIKFPRRR